MYSREQAQGVQQTNRSVGGVDGVVQENAANAEDGAATSTQLKEQAELMLHFVNRLTLLIEGCRATQELTVLRNEPFARFGSEKSSGAVRCLSSERGNGKDDFHQGVSPDFRRFESCLKTCRPCQWQGRLLNKIKTNR
jgi:hypothetical protein